MHSCMHTCILHCECYSDHLIPSSKRFSLSSEQNPSFLASPSETYYLSDSACFSRLISYRSVLATSPFHQEAFQGHASAHAPLSDCNPLDIWDLLFSSHLRQGHFLLIRESSLTDLCPFTARWGRWDEFWSTGCY